MTTEQTEIEGIEKTVKNDKNSEITSNVTETPNNTELIKKDLQKAIDDGLNLTEKPVYTKLFHEIAKKYNVSYQLVSLAAKSFTKTNQQKSESVQADKSTINLKPVGKQDKPARTAPQPKEESAPPRQKTKQDLENEKFVMDTELEFEATMIEMSFENIVMFEKSLHIPAPQMNKIKKMSKTIALYNNKMEQAGHPEKKINVGETILRYMIILGIVGMFGQPIVASLTTKSEKKEGIEKVTRSMRS